MREYYYLFELEHSHYNLSDREGLHLAATGKLPSYVEVTEDVYLYDPDDDIRTISSSFYLRIPDVSLRIIEQCISRQSCTSSQPVDGVSELTRRHELKEVFLDGRYKGYIPSKLQSRYYGPHEICPFPFQLSTLDREPYTFSADQLVFWTEDLEELVEQGLLQRRNSNNSEIAVHSNSPSNLPTDEALPKSTQLNDREQLPAHFKVLLDALGRGEQDNMDLLLAAWRAFWKDRHPNDGKPYPTNSVVQAWILKRMEGHGSQVIAANIAKIIRPKWAPKHRQSRNEK